MEQKEIRMDKKYTYRNGEVARIICIDAPHSSWPVIALDTSGIITRHTDMGISNKDLIYDLIEVKEKKVLWLNVYEDTGYSLKKFADGMAMDGRLARIKVEYEEGQFDE